MKKFLTASFWVFLFLLLWAFGSAFVFFCGFYPLLRQGYLRF